MSVAKYYDNYGRERWYFACRYKDSLGDTHMRKDTRYFTYEEAKEAEDEFKANVAFLYVPQQELLKFWRDNHEGNDYGK